MRIRDLQVAGFRGICDPIEMKDLGPFVILYGPNGSGKSNILSAIVQAVQSAQSPGFPISERDINNDCEEASVRIIFADETDTNENRVSVSWSRKAPTPFLRDKPTHGIDDINVTYIGAPRTIDSAPGVNGNIASMLFDAKNASDFKTRQRYASFKKLLQAPPLKRPPFDVVQGTQRPFEVREELPSGSADVPLDLAGLGMVQTYTIIAQIMLSDRKIAIIEEPEAHLHAPTTGIQLRQLLTKLVEDKILDQLWISTHSNLFDLDEAHYFDVSKPSGHGTVVEKRPLAEVDGMHLYEPGPAKHTLLEWLSSMSPEDTVFRDANGSPISARQMLIELRRDSPIVLDFYRTMTATALRSVRLRAKSTS